MKIKHLITFAVLSFLSLGFATACSSPSSISSNSTPGDVKVNPCAAKKTSSTGSSVGGALAQKLQGKPVVVDVYASWCPACKNIAPTISQLEKKYAGKVEFVVLDVSDKSTTDAAEAKAKELGLSEFLAANKTQTGSLTIVDPATGNILAQHRNNSAIDAYTKVLDVAIAK